MIRRHIAGEYNCPLKIGGEWVKGRLILHYEETELPINCYGQSLVMSKLKHHPNQSIIEPYTVPDMNLSHVLKIYPVYSTAEPTIEWLEGAEYISDSEELPTSNLLIFPQIENLSESGELPLSESA